MYSEDLFFYVKKQAQRDKKNLLRITWEIKNYFKELQGRTTHGEDGGFIYITYLKSGVRILNTIGDL